MLQYRLKVNIQYTLRTRIPFKEYELARSRCRAVRESDGFFFFFFSSRDERVVFFSKMATFFLFFSDRRWFVPFTPPPPPHILNAYVFILVDFLVAKDMLIFFLLIESEEKAQRRSRFSDRSVGHFSFPNASKSYASRSTEIKLGWWNREKDAAWPSWRARLGGLASPIFEISSNCTAASLHVSYGPAYNIRLI